MIEGGTDFDDYVMSCDYQRYMEGRLRKVVDYVLAQQPQVVMVAWQVGDDVSLIAVPWARVVAQGLAYEIVELFENRKAGVAASVDEDSGIDQ